MQAVQGLIEEGKEAIDEEEESEAYDIGLNGAAARVEHCEIAAYAAVIAMAKGLCLEEVAGNLQETLGEENAVLEKLEGKLRELILATGSGTSEDGETEEEEAPTRQPAKALAHATKDSLNKRV